MTQVRSARVAGTLGTSLAVLCTSLSFLAAPPQAAAQAVPPPDAQARVPLPGAALPGAAYPGGGVMTPGPLTGTPVPGTAGTITGPAPPVVTPGPMAGGVPSAGPAVVQPAAPPAVSATERAEALARQQAALQQCRALSGTASSDCVNRANREFERVINP